MACNDAQIVRRVLVLGASNVGKTSMINELIKLDKPQPTNNSATGCTQTMHSFPFYVRNNIAYEFIDTPGLFQVAIDDDSTVYSHLVRLLQEVRSGVHLIIFVERCGTIYQSAQDIYDLVINRMCYNKVNTIGVITGCEHEDNMSDWVTKNKIHFENRNMNFKKIVATCFANGGIFEETYRVLRERSSEDVWHAIEQFACGDQSGQASVSDNQNESKLILQDFIKRRKAGTHQQPQNSSKSVVNEEANIALPYVDYVAGKASTIVDTVCRCIGFVAGSVTQHMSSSTVQSSVQVSAKYPLMSDHVYSVLMSWLKTNQSFVLLYKMENEKFNPENFHRCCDRRGPTITLIRFKGDMVLGGYTSRSWESPYEPMWKEDPHAFLFHLSVSGKEETSQKCYKMKGPKLSATDHYVHSGPCFGQDGKELKITRQKNTGLAFVTFHPNHYFIDSDGLNAKHNVLAKFEFVTNEVEVYGFSNAQT